MAQVKPLVRKSVPAVFCAFLLAACSMSPTSRFWGRTVPPKDGILRYITGSEPESLDPVFGGQPESRIMVAIYDRLVEFHPRTMRPIPSLAKDWDVDGSGKIYTFHLRSDGRFSNGDPIHASDFEWSFKRLLDPKTASRYSSFGYEIKYAEAFNSGRMFVRKSGRFALRSGGSAESCAVEGPACLTVSGDPAQRKEEASGDPALASALEGAELVPVSAKDVAIEAPDPLTLRITLNTPAPYLVALLATQYFSVLDRKNIEKFGERWSRPENIVTSGAFRIAYDKPYDELFVRRNPDYWDAKNVHLEGIRFYPVEELSTLMNLYKVGDVDAIYNHTVPSAWFSYISQFKDEYLLQPELALMYYSFSVKKPPVSDLKVRKALSLAIDRRALSIYLKTTTPLDYFVPEGIFPEYEKIRAKVFDDLRKKDGISDADWNRKGFDPGRACRLLKEAGYKVRMVDARHCRVTGIPPRSISITYNTLERHKQVAEFVQAQWQQNLGIEAPIENMEWRSFLDFGFNVRYQGLIRAGWVGDYIDPFAFLQVWYTRQNNGWAGWYSPEYDQMLEAANAELDQEKRFALLAKAEYFLLSDQPCIPLQTSGTNWLKKPYVKGMYPNPGTMHPWKFVYIEQDPSKWDHDVSRIMSDPLDPKVAAQVADLEKTRK